MVYIQWQRFQADFLRQLCPVQALITLPALASYGFYCTGFCVPDWNKSCFDGQQMPVAALQLGKSFCQRFY
jgi:hypothetical protein